MNPDEILKKCGFDSPEQVNRIAWQSISKQQYNNIKLQAKINKTKAEDQRLKETHNTSAIASEPHNVNDIMNNAISMRFSDLDDYEYQQSLYNSACDYENQVFIRHNSY